MLPSVVQVRSDRGSGSGFVFDRLGHVLTNQHVVDGDRSLLLQLDGGRQVRAALVGEDEANDIAVLRADPEDLPAAAMGDSSTVRIGEPVIAIGSPLGLSGTVTAGIVSTTAREARLGSSSRQAVIQTDASINPGNSGGPLVDLDGRVVGVNTAIATVPGTGSGNIGIGFAVPIDRALRVAEGILPD
ncbi:S1C family serine protease [Marmoricola sp. Leaf446]|uniref:S1C family serine protease n=1 Tax=Marmoricola sp. Leaf446 TaxID=1736379 RepID=UPI001F17F5BC|nr:trypsin-like peptidase domain-containing protein [Marmoricola sp. Leaf446]